jgi:PST family polysaccharide transporter
MAGAVAVIRMAIGLCITKIIAVHVGPGGMALFGQFQSFMSATGAIAGGGTGNGVVKYLAQYHDEPDRRRRVYCTAVILGLVLSGVVAAVLLSGAPAIALALFAQEGYEPAIFAIAAGVVFTSTNATLIAALNGLKLTSHFFCAQVALGLLSLTVLIALVPIYGIIGAMIALVVSQPLCLIVILFLLPSALRISVREILRSADRVSAAQLVRFSAMALTTAIVVPASHIAIRDTLASGVSIQAAGCWHGMWRVSEVYLLFITSALSVYYLPRLSEIQDKTQLLHEIIGAAKYVIPAALASSAIIFLSRDLIIHMLFTGEFREMRELFAYQLVGDVLKVSAWLVAFLMLAKARTALYMISEIAFAALFVGLTIVLVKSHGLV